MAPEEPRHGGGCGVPGSAEGMERRKGPQRRALGRGRQHQPGLGDTRDAQVPQGWRSRRSFPPPYTPPRGETHSMEGQASTRARSWRRQGEGFGVLFNPFLPKPPRRNVWPSHLPSKGLPRRVPIPGPPRRVSAGTRALAEEGVGAVPRRGHDGFRLLCASLGCKGSRTLPSICWPPSLGGLRHRNVLFFQGPFFFFFSLLLCYLFFFLQNLLPVPADGAWPPPQHPIQPASPPAQLCPNPAAAQHRDSPAGTCPGGATQGTRGRRGLGTMSHTRPFCSRRWEDGKSRWTPHFGGA